MSYFTLSIKDNRFLVKKNKEYKNVLISISISD